MVAGGMILNCPVTVADVTRADTIYGPSIAALKGKTVRRSPERVVTDLIEVPNEILWANQNVSLYGDVSLVNTIPFFATISRNVRFTTVGNIWKAARSIDLTCEHVVSQTRLLGRDCNDGW
jgi:hypothetical protein